MNRTTLLILLGLFFSRTIPAQKSNLWLTYGSAKFLYAPGVEANLNLYKGFGLQAGVSCFFQSYDKNQVARITDQRTFNFYNTNLGISKYLLIKRHHRLGATAGLKIYYGPDFRLLHYYEDGDYPIYIDCSQWRPAFGADLGLFYSYKKITALLKYDTARGKWRVGIGYVFGYL